MAKRYQVAILGILLTFATIGLYWLDRLGLDAGRAYLWLFSIGFIFIIFAVVAKLVLKWDFWFEIPVSGSLTREIMMFFLGLGVIPIITGIGKLFSWSMQTSMIMAPLSSFGGETGVISFSALQAVTSNFWVFFIHFNPASQPRSITYIHTIIWYSISRTMMI